MFPRAAGGHLGDRVSFHTLTRTFSCPRRRGRRRPRSAPSQRGCANEPVARTRASDGMVRWFARERSLGEQRACHRPATGMSGRPLGHRAGASDPRARDPASIHLRSPQIDAFRCWGQIRAGDRLEVFCQSSPKVVRKLCAVEEYSGRGLVREGRDRCGDVAMMPMQPGELAANYGAPISRRGSDGWTRAGPRLRGFRGAYAARFLEPHPKSFAETD